MLQNEEKKICSISLTRKQVKIRPEVAKTYWFVTHPESYFSGCQR